MFFMDFQTLQYLYIQDNCLQTIFMYTFSGLLSIKIINLMRNPIISLKYGAFHECKHLRNLSLHDTGLLTIGPGAFAGLTNLYALYISQNQLTYIKGTEMEGLQTKY